jgi:hypothetical protein
MLTKARHLQGKRKIQETFYSAHYILNPCIGSKPSCLRLRGAMESVSDYIE